MAVYRHFGNRPKLFSLPISLVNDKGHYRLVVPRGPEVALGETCLGFAHSLVLEY
jgi:hypothetical protein